MVRSNYLRDVAEHFSSSENKQGVHVIMKWTYSMQQKAKIIKSALVKLLKLMQKDLIECRRA